MFDFLKKKSAEPAELEIPPELQVRLDAAAADVARLEAEYGEAALAVEEGDQLAAGRVVKAAKALDAAKQLHTSLLAAHGARRKRDAAQAAEAAAAAVRAHDARCAALHAEMVADAQAVDAAILELARVAGKAAESQRTYMAHVRDSEAHNAVLQTNMALAGVIEYRLRKAGVPGVTGCAGIDDAANVYHIRLPRLLDSATIAHRERRRA